MGSDEPGRGGLSILAALRFLRSVASEVGVVLEALGLEQRLPTVQLWKGLLEVIGRSGKPAVGPGAQARPPMEKGNARISPVAPAVEGGKAERIEAMLWDRGLESLLTDRQITGTLRNGEEPVTETDNSWAVVLLAAGTYQARLRALAQSKAKARKKTLAVPEA